MPLFSTVYPTKSLFCGEIKNPIFPLKCCHNMTNIPAVLSFSFSISHFFFCCWLALTGILKSDAVISGLLYIFFSPKFRTSFIVHEAVKVWPGNKSVHFKIWNLRNLFHDWRRLVKYPRLALEEVNVTFITMYCRYKRRTNFFSSDTNRDLASIKNHIRNVSGSQVTQSLIVMQIIDLLKTRPVDRADSMIRPHPM